MDTLYFGCSFYFDVPIYYYCSELSSFFDLSFFYLNYSPISIGNHRTSVTPYRGSQSSLPPSIAPLGQVTLLVRQLYCIARCLRGKWPLCQPLTSAGSLVAGPRHLRSPTPCHSPCCDVSGGLHARWSRDRRTAPRPDGFRVARGLADGMITTERSRTGPCTWQGQWPATGGILCPAGRRACLLDRPRRLHAMHMDEDHAMFVVAITASVPIDMPSAPWCSAEASADHAMAPQSLAKTLCDSRIST